MPVLRLLNPDPPSCSTRYSFPHQQGKEETNLLFYYNPYSGELSLDFPKASKKSGSGILADEMGLGTFHLRRIPSRR